MPAVTAKALDDGAQMRAVYACDPHRSRGRLHEEAESRTRSPFQRDRDRVIHSAAFRKLRGKTQVFVEPTDDYMRTRLSHSLEVAQIARSLARSLRLDEDLAEVVALAHDLGHTPFGHTGEDALHESMADLGGFDHNDQTLRILTHLEQRFPLFNGLNMTWEVLDGVVKHNGPLINKGQSHADLPTTLRELSATVDFELDRHSALEAQVAAIADDIAYNNHDMHDGLRAGFFTLDDLAHLPMVGNNLRAIRQTFPDLDAGRTLHELVRRNIGDMVDDILRQTQHNLDEIRPQSERDVRDAGRQIVAFSTEMQEIDKALRGFLWENMYRHYKVLRQRSKAWRLVQSLFDLFMEEPRLLPAGWKTQHGKVEDVEDETSRARLIADYIAGMTDRYAMTEYRRLFQLDSFSI